MTKRDHENRGLVPHKKKLVLFKARTHQAQASVVQPLTNSVKVSIWMKDSGLGRKTTFKQQRLGNACKYQVYLCAIKNT